MAIPKKPVEKSGPVQRAIRAVSGIPEFLQSIPTLPKGKLLKVTSYFMCTALFVGYLATGTREYFYEQRSLRMARQLEEQGVVLTSSASNPGTERSYKSYYGFDYREKIDERRESES